MAFDGSVSEWLGQLQEGEEAALAKLQQRYWPALVNRARRKLRDAPARMADEEDIAQEAFWAFYRSVKAGKLPRLNNRHDLWALLTHIVGCRAVNQIQHEIGTQKRGGGKVHGGSAFDLLTQSGAHAAVEPADEAAHSPLEQVILHDCYRQYVDGLPDNVRDFAEHYLAGMTHKEIAERMGVSERTVERKLALVLRRWQTQAAASLSQDWKKTA